MLPEWPVLTNASNSGQVLLRDGYRYLGLFLLAGFLVQEVARLRWPWLSAVQAGATYEQLSGFAVLGLVVHQWYLAASRSRGPAHTLAGQLRRHRWAGALAPAFLYAHSQGIGFAYVATLSLVYLAVSSIGLLNINAAPALKAWLQICWMVIHVGLATALLFLTGYHVFISYAYE